MKKWITLLILTSAVAGAWAGNSSRVATFRTSTNRRIAVFPSAEKKFADANRCGWSKLAFHHDAEAYRTPLSSSGCIGSR